MWFRSEYRKLRDQLEDLMDERDDLKARLRKYESSDNRFKETFDDVQKSTFSFDWDLGKAFSIERVHEWASGEEMYIPTTVIGYFAPDASDENPDKFKVGEWRFYCSQKEHDRLVKEFNDRRAQK